MRFADLSSTTNAASSSSDDMATNLVKVALPDNSSLRAHSPSASVMHSRNGLAIFLSSKFLLCIFQNLLFPTNALCSRKVLSSVGCSLNRSGSLNGHASIIFFSSVSNKMARLSPIANTPTEEWPGSYSIPSSQSF